MNRRLFIGGASTLGAGLLVGCEPDPAEPGTEPRPSGDVADPGPDLQTAVPRSLMSSATGSQAFSLDLLSGRIPEDWFGNAYVIQPEPYEDGTPIFSGEPRLLRFELSPGAVAFSADTLKTPCHYADVAFEGQPQAFVSDGFARTSQTLGVRNFVNTALVSMGDRLIATTDAGRPWVVDPVDLSLVTPVGWLSEWRTLLPDFVDQLTGWMFPIHMSTAHPAVDPETGTLFTVNISPVVGVFTGFTRVLRWDGEGDLHIVRIVDESGNNLEFTQSVHQIGLTRNYLILLDAAFIVEVDPFGPAPTRAHEPHSVIHVIPRSALDGETATAKTFVIARESVHFLVDFDDSDGIVLILAHNVASDPSEVLEPGDTTAAGEPVDATLHGMLGAATDLNAMGRYVLDYETGAFVDQKLLHDPIFWGGPSLFAQPTRAPERHGNLFWTAIGLSHETRLTRLEAMYADHPNRTVPIAELPDFEPSTVFRVDAVQLTLEDSYALPAGRIAITPVFAPREGSTGDTDGYLLVTVISDDTDTPGSSGDELWVFDAANLAQGPIARLGHPELSMPFTLHPLFLETAAPSQSTYRVDLRQDFEARAAGLPQDVRDVLLAEVFPHFD